MAWATETATEASSSAQAILKAAAAQCGASFRFACNRCGHACHCTLASVLPELSRRRQSSRQQQGAALACTDETSLLLGA